MTEAFVGLGKLILLLIGTGILLAFAVGLLIVLLISIIYFTGYLYDSIVGNLGMKFGTLVLRKIPRAKNIKIVSKMCSLLQPKEIYLRYETPLCTYCFSYSAISILCGLVPYKYGISFQYVISSFIYLACYFIGMGRKCGSDSEYYKKILKNNLDFLKLSFLPMTFLITIFGFAFTVTGFKIQDLHIDTNYIQNTISGVVEFNDNTDVVIMVIKLILIAIILLALLYIISLPIQLISYFVILVIQYFREHGNSYFILLKKYASIVKYLLKQT